MHRLFFTAFVLVGGLIPSYLPAQRPPDPERDAVQTVIADFAAHIQANDLASLDTFFPPRGLHILTDDATTHGWAEYRDQYLTAELARYSDLSYSHTAIEPVVRGNVAWVAFRREFRSGAATEPVQGRGTAVLEKRDGRWVIVHLHMSQ